MATNQPDFVELVDGAGILKVPTVADIADETNGTITVTIDEDPLVSDNTMDATYLRGTKTTATITVEDNDDPDTSKPRVTISGPANAEEGDSLVYTVTAAPAPANPQRLIYGESKSY